MEKSRGTRSGRAVAVIAIAVASLVAFASFGGVGLARNAVGLAQYQYGEKVTICHKGKRTIRISVRAWPAHKRHGDTQGACATVVKQEKQNKRLKGERGDAGQKNGKQAREARAQKTEGGGNGKGNGKGQNT